MNRTDLQNSGIYNNNALEYKILNLKVENKSIDILGSIYGRLIHDVR